MESSSWPKILCDASGLTTGNYQVSYRKSALPTTCLVHSQCTIVPEGVSVKGSESPGRPYSWACRLPHPIAFIQQPLYLDPLAKASLRHFCGDFLIGEKRGKCKETFLYSDSKLSIFLLVAIYSLLPWHLGP